jgi:hypothetical protein
MALVPDGKDGGRVHLFQGNSPLARLSSLFVSDYVPARSRSLSCVPEPSNNSRGSIWTRNGLHGLPENQHARHQLKQGS